MTDLSPMNDPESEQRLAALISDDPSHVYSEEELDAIEAIDPELAYRLDRAQVVAEREQEATDRAQVEGPVDEAQVQEAIAEAKAILNRDGGDIELVAVEGPVVRVQMKGACAGCPRSALDLRNVVERLVRNRAPNVAKVVNNF